MKKSEMSVGDKVVYQKGQYDEVEVAIIVSLSGDFYDEEWDWGVKHKVGAKSRKVALAQRWASWDGSRSDAWTPKLVMPRFIFDTLENYEGQQEKIRVANASRKILRNENRKKNVALAEKLRAKRNGVGLSHHLFSIPENHDLEGNVFQVVIQGEAVVKLGLVIGAVGGMNNPDFFGPGFELKLTGGALVKMLAL